MFPKDKPLPWTHGVVRHFIEHRARHDAMAAWSLCLAASAEAMGGDLVRLIQEAVDEAMSDVCAPSLSEEDGW